MSELEEVFRRIAREEADERARKIVEEAMAALPLQAREREPLVDIRRACEDLDISETKLREMVRAKSVPFYTVGAAYRFDLDELRAALKVKTQLRKVG